MNWVDAPENWVDTPESTNLTGFGYDEGNQVLTVEFKINLLRPAQGDRLRCRAKVLRAGRTIIVSESEVFAVKDGSEKMTAKATVTLAVVRKQAR